MNISQEQNCIILGASRLQLPLIQEAKNRNWKTFVIDKNKQAVGVAIADHFIEASIYDISIILPILESFEISFHLCCTMGTDASFSVAKINQHFKLNGINIKQASIATHKGYMRDFLKQKVKVRQPQYLYTNQKEQIYDFIKKNIGIKKWIIKPTHNMGARGVMIIQHIDQVSYAFEFAESYSKTGEVIIEEFIDGDELSIDCLVYEKKAYITGIADRVIKTLDNHYCIETGHIMPSQKHSNSSKKIEQILTKVAEEFVKENSHNLFYGALKSDIRITENGEIIIGEFATRLSGGFMSSHTYPYASTNNLVSGYLDILEKKLPTFIQDNLNNKYTSICIESAIIPPIGKITNIEYDINKIQKKQNNKKIEIIQNYKNGDIIYPLKNNVGKAFHIICTSDTVETAQDQINKIKREILFSIQEPSFSYKQIAQTAKSIFSKDICWGCKVCDGKHCASSVPGMGGIEPMQTFYKNYTDLQKIQIIPKYLEHNKQEAPKTKANFVEQMKFSFLGETRKLPVFSAPITGSKTNMGGATTEWDYAIETGSGMKHLGLFFTFGDGATEDKYLIGLNAIKQLKGGFPVFKPRSDLESLQKRIEQAEVYGAKAWGMDVDGLWFRTMLQKKQATSRKSINDLQILSNSSSLPFFIKGILSVEDAEIACISGASAIVVSNHGGRVLDGVITTCQALPSIVKFIRSYYPHVKILVDGGIRSGNDIFKMLALGADGVMIGRSIAIATVAYGRLGVISLLQQYIEEFIKIIHVLGINSLSEINEEYLQQPSPSTRF